MNSTSHTTKAVTATNVQRSRLAWAFADAWTITIRDLRHWQLQPGPVILGWFFPIMIALMFGLLFGGALRVPEGGSYFAALMPGIFTMTMLFGLETTMIAVTTDATKGITDRFRALPIHASAVVLGRCLADLLNSLVGLVILIGVGLLLDWRWHNGLGAALAAVGLLLWLRFALLWVGIFMGLQAKGPESVVAVQILVWPVSFLSNIFVDPATMPTWLGMVAQWNPLSATATAIRQLFLNPGGQGDTWVVQQAIWLAILWPGLLLTIFLPLAVGKYRRLSR
ncbi:MAG: ABC transporter permease [Caldilinea sp. CFX5]|nr:ABC transporter permease [Caldilinea sp. CFX5]